ncbi:DUF3887 domain-containing protein [Lacinutrix salivirga]
MKKYILIFALLCFTFSFAQTEKANYKKVAETFKQHYNNGDVVSIQNMFDANMQQVSPLERTKAFFKKTIKAETLGAITSITLKTVQRGAHTYTMQFENGVCEVFFLLDNQNKVSGFQMFPQKTKNN